MNNVEEEMSERSRHQRAGGTDISSEIFGIHVVTVEDNTIVVPVCEDASVDLASILEIQVAFDILDSY
jgi:hypothetical protein